MPPSRCQKLDRGLSLLGQWSSKCNALLPSEQSELRIFFALLVQNLLAVCLPIMLLGKYMDSPQSNACTAGLPLYLQDARPLLIAQVLQDWSSIRQIWAGS